MKYLILAIFISVLFFSCNKEVSYTIRGTLADTTQTTIYLQQRINGAYVDVDSALLLNGNFELKGTVDVVEEYYLSKGEGDKKMFFLENTAIKVVADSIELKDALIRGGSVQALYTEYTEKYDRLYDYMLKIYYAARDEKDKTKQMAMEARVDSLYENVLQFQEVFMLENSVSPVAAHILTRIQYGKSGDELNELLQKLDPSLVHMNSYQFLDKRVAALQKVAIGATAPDFTQNDVNGNPITFSDVYRANKLTLIDFWASWCGPCRAENPNVLAAYEKYNTKGFTVFGVSLDNKKERWLKAIEEDGLTWQHVSDLKGWGNEFSKEYAVNSIPASFLVNQDGQIVGVNLVGEELVSKLDELLN